MADLMKLTGIDQLWVADVTGIGLKKQFAHQASGRLWQSAMIRGAFWGGTTE